MPKRRSLLLHLAGLAGTGFVMGMVFTQEQCHPIVARAQRQSLLADHNPTHCAWVRSDADHMHLCKPRIRHVCIVHRCGWPRVKRYFCIFQIPLDERIVTVDKTAGSRCLLTADGGVSHGRHGGYSASCGDCLVVLERIRLR